MIKFIMSFAISFSLVLPLGYTQAQTNSVVKPLEIRSANEVEASALKASLSVSEELAVKMLLLSLVLEESLVNVVEVDPIIEKRFGRIRSSLFATPILAPLTYSAGHVGYKSLKEVEFIFKPLTEAFRFSARSTKATWNQFVRLLDALPLEPLFEASAESGESVYTHSIKPTVEILKSSITKGTLLMSGFGILAGSVVGSVALWSGPKKVMASSDMARQLLGQDEKMSETLDETLNPLQSAFSISEANMNVLKEALLAQIISESVKYKFSTSEEDLQKYDVNIVEIAREVEVLDEKSYQATLDLVNVYRSVREEGLALGLTDREKLYENIQTISDLGVLLESALVQGKVQDEASVKKLKTVLGEVSVNLELLQLNLQN